MASEDREGEVEMIAVSEPSRPHVVALGDCRGGEGREVEWLGGSLHLVLRMVGAEVPSREQAVRCVEADEQQGIEEKIGSTVS